MKNLRKLREEHGAGEWGTPELTNKYKSETPGQQQDEGHEEDAQAAHQAAHAALKKGDIDTYHKEMDKKFASHQAAAEIAAKKPVKTFEETVTESDSQTREIAAYHKKLKGMKTDEWTKHVHKYIGADKALGYSRKGAEHEILRQKFGRDAHSRYATGLKEAFTPDQGLLDRIKKDHEELKNKSTKDILAIHQGQHRVRSSYTAAEIGGKHAMIGDILRNRHGDKHVSHYFGTNEATTTIEKPVAEDSDEQKNLKITKHEKAAVEAGKKGDKQAQQYHLNAVKNLKTESVNEATEKKELKHLVTVTVSDPHHAMQSKRKEKIMKRVRVSAADPKTAVAKAEAHYKRHGYKVHDSLHHSIVESLDTDEFIDSKDQATRAKDDEDDITNNPAFTDTEDEKGLPKEVSFGESTEQDDNDDENETGLSDEEKTQLGKIKTLIRLGLIDGSQMNITLRAVKKLDLDQPVTSSQERQAINTLLQQLIGVVTGDDTVFRKIRLNVQK